MKVTNSFKVYDKNIISKYLKGNLTPTGHGKVNLLPSNANKSTQTKTKHRSVTITMKTKLTGMEMKRKIKILKKQEVDEALEWLDDMEETLASSNWSDDEKMEILKEVICHKT